MEKIWNKLRKVCKWTVCVLLCICVLAISVQAILTRQEQKKYPCYGKMINIQGKKMCLSIRGKGEKTIVLLPGLGTTSPVLDFEPLAQQLAEKYTVLTVEPFGYGYSEISPKERTLQNEIEELHEALQKSGLKGPYIFMPHSVYGIDTIAYVNQYPEDVCGVIGIDMTLPRMNSYFQEDIPKSLPSFLGYLHYFGIMRLLTQLSPEGLISSNTQGLYSDENIKMQKRISAWKAQNRNVVDQYNHLSEHINTTLSLTFPEELPILFFTQLDQKDNIASEKTSSHFYETYISNPEKQRVITMKATHYMHWTCTEEMVEEIQKQF